MNVEDLVQQRIEAARRRAEATKERRAKQAAARQAGLAKRNAAKLRHLAECEPKGGGLCPPAAAAETDSPQSSDRAAAA